MENTSSGYTIIEVLLVTAISGLLLVTAMATFSGQRGSTEFSQAMQDISSKIQSYANQVNAGTFQAGQNYGCQVSGGRPVVATSGSGVGANQDCIFLGRAVQAVAENGILYVYTVVGTRNKYVSGSDTGQVATTISESNPEPAIDGSGNWILVDDYKLSYGLTLVSSKIGTDNTTAYNLVGIYTNLQTNNATATSGSTSLTLRAYPFSGDSSTVKQTAVRQCIEEITAVCSTSFVDTNSWNLCFRNSDGSRKAKLIVNREPTGVTTQLSFTECS